MFRFLPLIVIVQVFCLYHAYKHGADQRWFWFIIFFPLIGSIIYLYYHFYNKKNLATVSEGIKGIVNSNHHVEKLEQQLKHTDSDLNKMRLADKYLEINRIDDAITLYESCIASSYKVESSHHYPLMECYYKKEEYAKVVELGEQLDNTKEYNKSKAKICYAWSLYQIGEIDNAKKAFQETDFRFSNYEHRLQYIKFLQLTDQKEASLEIIEELHNEFEVMTKEERRRNGAFFKELQTYLVR